jgi:aarF domain-containing kinase
MQHGIRCLHASRFVLEVRTSIPKPQLFHQHFPSVTQRAHNGQFSPLRPPDPAALPKPRSEKFKQRRRVFLRRLIITSVACGTIYLIDRRYQASSITRSLRTFYTGLVVGFDYKINFRANPPFANSIEELHARSAQRIFDLIRTNGGLYLKIGQAIAMQSAVLPPQFQKMFARMFDDAPQNDWNDVEATIREEFGASPEDVFGLIEKTARASASVAQVHWARLPDGSEVAVKIQKREIAQQIGWDLWSWKVVSRIYSWWFDIPMHTLVPYISERLMLETDFENEANNSEELDKCIQKESRLRNRIYIPKVHHSLSTKKVLTTEWIEGVRLWDLEGITSTWKGDRYGSPGAGGHTLKPLPLQQNNPEGFYKPDRSDWRGPRHNGGLGVTLKDVMTTMVDLFSAQMFLFGLVHCDPHPGNIFIRRLPSGKPEVVLIDHGLYIRMSPEFRITWAEFWKALISFDNQKLQEIVCGWGITNMNMFASATLMRPYSGDENNVFAGLEGKSQQERSYIMQRRMQKGIKEMLSDEAKWPRELIFLWRNLRIVQGNNQFMGSPVNRIKITGVWASRALVETPELPLGERFANFWRHMLFRLSLLASDLVWWTSRFRQMTGKGQGMEDDIEEQMKRMAKSEFGVELNHELFDG